MAFFAQGEGSPDVPRLLPSCFKKELSTGATVQTPQGRWRFWSNLWWSLGLFCIWRMRKWISTIELPRKKPTWKLKITSLSPWKPCLPFWLHFGVQTPGFWDSLRRTLDVSIWDENFWRYFFYSLNRMWWRFLEHVLIAIFIATSSDFDLHFILFSNLYMVAQTLPDTVTSSFQAASVNTFPLAHEELQLWPCWWWQFCSCFCCF